jgi:hypothetical protein
MLLSQYTSGFQATMHFDAISRTRTILNKGNAPVLIPNPHGVDTEALPLKLGQNESDRSLGYIAYKLHLETGK